MAGFVVVLNLTYENTPLKLTGVGATSSPVNVIVAISAHGDELVTWLANVACTVIVPVNPVAYTAAVCNASLPFTAGSALTALDTQILVLAPVSVRLVTEEVFSGPGNVFAFTNIVIFPQYLHNHKHHCIYLYDFL